MKAPCPLYRKCSGCSRMQFPYVKQIHDKGRMAREVLGRFIGAAGAPGEEGQGDALQPVAPSPAELGYRTSTKLCLNEDEFGRRTIGLYERGTKKVIAIPACPVHHPAINQLVQRLFSGRVPAPAPFYSHAKRGFQPGRLKFVTVRYCPDTQAFGIVLSHTGVDPKVLATWAVEIAAPNISIYGATLRKADDDLILSNDVTHLAGPPDVPFVIGPMTFRLDPLAFFQANYSLTPRFVEHITTGTGGDTLLDLYGGFGAYGLAAATRFKKVYLVDANSHAVEAARKMIKSTGVANAVAAEDSVETFLERRLKPEDRRQVSHVIVNPPRGGLSARARELLAGAHLPNVTALTYVSCNIETLKRDLGALTQGGFRVQSIQPFDMFPQTDHLELVVKLTRRGAPKGATPRDAAPRSAKTKDRGFAPKSAKTKDHGFAPKSAKPGRPPAARARPGKR